MRTYEERLLKHARAHGLPDPLESPSAYVVAYSDLPQSAAISNTNVSRYRSSTDIVHAEEHCGSTVKRKVTHAPSHFDSSRMAFERICGKCVDDTQADHLDNRSVWWAIRALHKPYHGGEWARVAIPALIPQLEQVARRRGSLSGLAGRLAEFGEANFEHWRQTVETWSRLATNGVVRHEHGPYRGALKGPWFDRRLFGSTDPDRIMNGTDPTEPAFVALASGLTTDSFEHLTTNPHPFRSAFAGNAPANLSVFDHLDVAEDERPLSARLTEAWQHGMRNECDKVLGKLSEESPYVTITYDAPAAKLRSGMDLHMSKQLFSFTPWNNYDPVNGTLEAVVPLSMAEAHISVRVTGSAAQAVRLSDAFESTADGVARMAQTLYNDNPEQGLKQAYETAELVLAPA